MKHGQLVAVDVGHRSTTGPFLNTASFGSYSKLVEAREKLEDSIGKWAALAVALVRVLRDDEPFEVTIDGRTAPHLDDLRRQLRVRAARLRAGDARRASTTEFFDVRIVDGSHPWARVRLVAAALTGNLARSRVYTRQLVRPCHVRDRCRDTTRSPPTARSSTATPTFTVEKHDDRLLVYVAGLDVRRVQ